MTYDDTRKPQAMSGDPQDTDPQSSPPATLQEAGLTIPTRDGMPTIDGRADAGSRTDTSLPQQIIQGFLDRQELEILFDGTLRRRGPTHQVEKRADLDAWLARPRPDATWLLDEIMLEAQDSGAKLTLSDIQRALRTMARAAAQSRSSQIIKRLIDHEFPAPERRKAEAQWQRLVTTVFENEATLAKAILQHFIWQVQQKLLDRPVQHHLMPVVLSPLQGSGKTTFVRRFLEPLEEMASRPVLLADLADARSGDIFRYPVVLVDDMEQIDPRHVPVLKSLLTSDGVRRRRLGTSLSIDVAQRATFIGTSNEEIGDLIADETGHRRFASLRFRNGQAAKGGDARVWSTVQDTDMGLLWRSVDPFEPSPLEAHLPALVAMQEADTPPDEVALWLADLDLTSSVIKMISTAKGVKAASLYKLFQTQTGSRLSLTRFGKSMLRHARDPKLPFEARVTTAAGIVYPCRDR